MKKTILSTICFLTFLLLAQAAVAQHNSDLKFRRFRVTLVPGLSTNGLDAKDYSAKYSLNIIAGYHGALDGYEIGIVNINRVYTEGFQVGVLNGSGGDMAGLNIASLVNYADGDMAGLQFGGLANVSRGYVQGLQFAGLVNAGLDGIQGLQFAGIANIAGDEIQGLQFAGIANIAAGNVQGLQFAGVANAGAGDVQGIIMSGVGNFGVGYSQGILASGVVNVAEEIQGISLAGVLNVGKELQGIQISGVANIAQSGEGIQIGLINTAQYFEGVPVGLISYYGNGRKNLDFWADEGGFLHAGLKLGTMDIYNMISFGYNSVLNDEEVWDIGWSIGSHAPLEEAWNSPRYDGYFRMKDFTVRTLQENEKEIWKSSMYSFRYMLGKELSGGFGLYAGPSLNMLVSDKDDEQSYTSYSLIDTKAGDSKLKFWIGFSAGIQLF